MVEIEVAGGQAVKWEEWWVKSAENGRCVCGTGGSGSDGSGGGSTRLARILSELRL